MSQKDNIHEEPFRSIQQHRSVLRDIQKMQDNLDELEEAVKEAEWMALGGRGVYEPERIDKLTAAVNDGVSHIRDDIHALQREPDNQSHSSE